jgi:NitT/TauT family transport system ATP-binding protein
MEKMAANPPQSQTQPQTQAAPKISLKGVGKRYHARQAVLALDGVDLDIPEGEFVALLGPSGCGKSTILRMLAGLNRPSEGSVAIRAAGVADGQAGRAATAMVFQSYNVFPWKTIEDNVRFGLQMIKVPAAEAAERTARWLRKMGLSDFAGSYPAALSGGMLQRVSIARALAVEPDILLMDEPFAALDAQHRRIMQEELLQLWQENRRTVVFVTHSIEEAILLADQIMVMSARPGRVISRFAVPFPRPRSASVRTDPAFARLEQDIWDILRLEVDRAYAANENLREEA